MLEIEFMKVNPHKVDRLKQWMAQLASREHEAIATLEQETVHTESAFLLDTTQGPVLVYIVEAEDMQLAKQMVKENPHPIDHEHRAVMQEVIEGPAKVEQLLHLSR